MLIKQVRLKNVDFVIIDLDAGFKFEEHVCNGCHDLLTMAYYLEKIAILSAKGATFRCILWGIGVRILRNEGLEIIVCIRNYGCLINGS